MRRTEYDGDQAAQRLKVPAAARHTGLILDSDGAAPWVTTPVRRLPHQDLDATQRTVNRALSAARAPVEQSVTRLKSLRFPPGSLQPQPPVVNLRRSPHPEAPTLKTLTDQGWDYSPATSPQVR